MDQYASDFVSKFGVPTEVTVVPDASFVKYEHVLPECLLSLWREYGWGGFKNGIFWLVDPDDFEHIGNAWIQNFPEFSETGVCVFGRSAFGCLYAYHPESGKVLDIICPMGYIMTQKSKSKGKVSLMQVFFAAAEVSSFDLVDEGKNPLFEDACKTLGPLQANEVYGFEPILTLGGLVNLAHLRKLRMNVHLDIIRQFAEPNLYVI